MKVLAIIPARFQSSRLPGKPLLDLGGKPMIQRVYEQAIKSTAIQKVIIATDDQRIIDAAIGFNAIAMLTSPDHRNGTERCVEVWAALDEKWDVVINIQGDEPFIQPQHIEALLPCFDDAATKIATLMKTIDRQSDIEAKSIVKIHINDEGNAVNFSRKPIDSNGVEHGDGPYYKHVALYAFRPETMETVTKLDPTEHEQSESLEQLRWLDNGYKIALAKTKIDSFSIDTEADYQRALERFN